MSNRFNGEVVVIDTTDTQVGGPSATSGGKGPLTILGMQWVGTQASTMNIAADDDLTIKLGDVDGDIIIAVRADNAAYDNTAVTVNQVQWTVSFCSGWTVPGLYIEDIDGGELIIYLK